MPTATFFHLPEEKRERLNNAAWDEFTRVPYAEASINRIVSAARIPRGSFYQYFEDKNDLFSYIIDQLRGGFLQLLDQIREDTGGDIFAIPMHALDAFILPDGSVAPRYKRDFALLQLNRSMDMTAIFLRQSGKELCAQGLPEGWGSSELRRSDALFADCTFTMLVAALGTAIAHIVFDPTSRARESELLSLRVDIIRNGSAVGGKG